MTTSDTWNRLDHDFTAESSHAGTDEEAMGIHSFFRVLILFVA